MNCVGTSLVDAGIYFTSCTGRILVDGNYVAGVAGNATNAYCVRYVPDTAVLQQVYIQVTNNWFSNTLAIGVRVEYATYVLVSGNQFGAGFAALEALRVRYCTTALIHSNIAPADSTIVITNNTDVHLFANVWANSPLGTLGFRDGVAAPAASMTDQATMWVDTAGAGGDLKIRFADGTVKTIVADT